MTDRIETERLTLDLVDLRDAAFIKALLNSEGWIQNIGDRNVNTLEDAQKYIELINKDRHRDYYVVRLKGNFRRLGVVSFVKRENQNFPDIGFAFLPRYGGKGYAFEAAKAFLDRIVGQGLWGNVIGIALAANVRSIKLLEKLGMRYRKTMEEGGQLKVIYSLYELGFE